MKRIDSCHENMSLKSGAARNMSLNDDNSTNTAYSVARCGWAILAHTKILCNNKHNDILYLLDRWSQHIYDYVSLYNLSTLKINTMHWEGGCMISGLDALSQYVQQMNQKLNWQWTSTNAQCWQPSWCCVIFKGILWSIAAQCHAWWRAILAGCMMCGLDVLCQLG